MKINKWLKIVYALMMGFVGILFVKANNNPNEAYMMQMLANTSSPKINSVNIDGDIAIISSSGNVAGYYIGYGSSNVSASTTKYYKSNANKYYIGVKNGTYYFWVYGSGTSDGNLSAIRYNGAVNVTTSCTNQKLTNRTDSGTVESCYVSTGGQWQKDYSGSLVTCASGYDLKLSVKYNGCSNSPNLTYNGNKLARRYCKAILNYSCTKPSGSDNVAAPSLTSLSVGTGSLSPAFSSGTTSYKVSVGAGVSSIKVNATAANGSSFVSGYGARTVKLSYGSNKVYVKVKNNAGTIKTYTIVVKRADNRSSVNTLSSLTVDKGTLSPAFSPSVNTYAVTVANNVNSITVGATLKDSKSSFVKNFNPRTEQLKVGNNSVQIKVKSENGKTNVYTINVLREGNGATSCTAQIENLALLKRIDLSSALSDTEISQLVFDPKRKVYDVSVPYDVSSLIINAYVNDEGDTVEVNGGENLEVGEETPNIVTITVTSLTCPEITSTYTLNVTRLESVTASNDSTLKSLTIKNHSEVDFKPENDEFNITLKKNETAISESDIVWEATNEGTTCVLSDNTKLQKGSKMLLTCTSADNTTKTIYTFKVTKVAKGMNVFLTILLIIIILLIVVYLVLRLLGYKIYFNFGVIGAFFRGLGERIRNIFDR